MGSDRGHSRSRTRLNRPQHPAAARPLSRPWRMGLLAGAIAAIGAPAWANPTGAQVVQGSATLQRNGATLSVTTSNGAVIHWNQFNIGVGETTRFIQPSAASQVLNRVVSGALADSHRNITHTREVERLRGAWV